LLLGLFVVRMRRVMGPSRATPTVHSPQV
jgi:hypothetical protein